ncbi:hypothetical protein ACWET9_00775 [Streptomyces sp. NPDC004059]
MWIDQLISAVHWEPLGLPMNWARVEGELGVTLPSDYKRLCESFGPGEFSEYLDVLCVNEGPGPDILKQWRACVEVAAGQETPESPHPLFAPYHIFERDRPAGLIPWGVTQMECEFHWLADSGDPNEWPVIARFVDSDWDRFDISTTEFVVRVLTDPEFRPYSVAGIFPDPYFQPLPQLPGRA